MKIEVEVISREAIKPSSPTPDRLRHYQFSFLDQISPPVYMPLILFYEKDGNYNHFAEKSNQLKTSLAEALTRFYPLAGRVKNMAFIDCNDEGIPYIEAKANCHLSEILQEPVPDELNKFLPYQIDDNASDLLFGVQVNGFECGGMAIGLCFSHKVADALSFFMFIKSWAATARGDTNNILSPQFDSAQLFPPLDLSGRYRSNTDVTKENIVTKRFVFTTPKIVALREKYASTMTKSKEVAPKRPSRVEALSAFIWTRFVAATQSTTAKIHTVIHAVNLRKQMKPPLPEHSFGNLYRFAMTVPVIDEDGECHSLVSQIREEIRKIDGDYIAKLRDGDEHLSFLRDLAQKVIHGELVSFSFTSLCGFPLYENDFGWGKPVWIGSARKPFKNLVSLIDTKSGDGVEAWIILKEEDMAKLEGDKEFLSFAYPNSA